MNAARDIITPGLNVTTEDELPDHGGDQLMSPELPLTHPSRYPEELLRIPGYTFERDLARGGMGCVRVYRRDRDGRPGVVKSLRWDCNQPERLQREIAVARRLAPHPHVIPIEEW